MTWQDTLATLDDAIGGKLRVSVATSQSDFTYQAGASLVTADGSSIRFPIDTLVQLTKRQILSKSGGTPPISASVGLAIRARLIYVGRLYDKVESDEHVAWRQGIVALLAAADAEAAKVDGKPPSTIDQNNPLDARAVVVSRLSLAIQRGGPALLVDLREQVRALDASGEPRKYGEGFPDSVLLARTARLKPGTLEAVDAIEQDARDWIAFASGDSQ